MKKTLSLLIVMLCLFLGSNAQSSSASSQNTEYAKKIDAIGGHFDHSINDKEKVSIAYKLTPKSPVDVAKFSIGTPFAMPFWATITDNTGKTVYTWKPEVENYTYTTDINVSTLKSGQYTMNIFLATEKESIHHFNFIKQ